MMTAASIGAGEATDYGAYLESRTVASARGDYYLSAEGEPVEAPGRWHILGETLERLGLRAGEPVRAEELVALMEGRHPAGGEFIRRAGCDGRRAAGSGGGGGRFGAVGCGGGGGSGGWGGGGAGGGGGGGLLARARDVIAAE